MAYTIYKADGTAVNVPDSDIDITFYNPSANGPGKGIGTQLVGRNAVNYGAPIAQNLLQLTENFAGTVLPTDSTSLVGQLWFDKTSSSLYVKVSTAGAGIANWRTIPTVNPVTPSDGDVQVLTGPTRINIWAAGAWQQVFPAIYS